MKPRTCKKSVDYGDLLLTMVLFGLFVMVAGLMAAMH